jgi:hypothetical protein
MGVSPYAGVKRDPVALEQVKAAAILQKPVQEELLIASLRPEQA